MKHLFTLLFVSCITLTVFSQADYSKCKTIADVESTMNNCLEKEVSTAGQIDCASGAVVAADKILNSLYKETIKKCTAALKTQLTQSQKNWITYKEDDAKLQNVLYKESGGGTMYLPMIEHRKFSIIKERCEYLSTIMQRL